MSQLLEARWVILLETDERAGLVANVSAECAAAGVSLEITTGPGHVLLTVQTPTQVAEEVVSRLRGVGGVQHVHRYEVLPV